MPVIEKVKNLLHRNHAAPEAPAAPLVAPVEPLAAPLNNNLLLQQKEALVHPELDRNHDGRVDAAELNRANSLDRNLDGRVDAADMLVGQQTAYVQTAQRASLVRAEPTIIETIQKDVVIHERIHPVEKEEIQPIIYREREQLDVKQVTQMMHETMIQPTLIEQRELPAERREAIVERGVIPENIILPTREVDVTSRSQVVHAPIIEEVIKKTIIEEVQPVLERDIYQPVIIQNTQAIHEKIIEAPVVYRQITETRELGTRGVDSTFSHNDLSGRRLSQTLETAPLSQGMYQTGTTVPLSNEYQGDRRLSQTLMEQELLNNQRLANNGAMVTPNVLPTGQVLPNVASTRPAYAYLPAGHVENRPTFIGTSSDFVRAAGTLPASTMAHSKALPTASLYGNQAQPAPQVLLRQ